jgi:hypothetical protein
MIFELVGTIGMQRQRITFFQGYSSGVASRDTISIQHPTPPPLSSAIVHVTLLVHTPSTLRFTVFVIFFYLLTLD